MNNINIAIADDHVLLRKALAELVESESDMSVQIQADNGAELIAQLGDLTEPPDVCVLDISMPVMDGYKTIEVLKEKWHKMKVLVLTLHEHEYAIINMLQKGANGYIVKSCEPDEFLTAIRSISKRGFYHTELVAEPMAMLMLEKRASIPMIAKREMEFLKLCCTEHSYTEMARLMNISTRTAEGYRDTLFKKLKVKSRTGLVLFALQSGIVPLSG